MNIEEIKNELKEISEELGRFPRKIDLQNLRRNDLCYQICKSKITFMEYAKMLGYKTKHRSKNYWNEETIIQEIKSIIEKEGGWPSKEDWQEKYAYLKRVIFRLNFNFKYFRNKLNITKLAKAKEIKCKQCKNIFLPPFDPNWTRQKFCSGECRENFFRLKQNERNAKRIKQPRVCPICNKTFIPNFTSKQKYCDRRCYANFRKRLDKAVRTTMSYIGCAKNGKNCHKLLGYSAEHLLSHLQSFPQWEVIQDKDWHLDHIFPVKAFIDKEIHDVKLICSLDNLQPLLAEDNATKGCKYDEQAFETWLDNHK